MAGIFLNMPRAEYDALDRLNYSLLKNIERSPAHFQQAKKTPRKDTDAMRVGRALDLALLGPDEFACLVRVYDGKRDKRVKAYQEFLAAQRAGSKTEVLTQEESDNCIAAADAVRSNPDIAEYLVGESQVTLLVDEAGVPMKARLDMVCTNGALLDLKKTRDARCEAFGRQAWNLGYCTQAAWYRRAWWRASGEKILRPFCLLAVEVEPPYAHCLYVVPDSALRAGEEQLDRWLSLYKRCAEADKWPGYMPIDWLQLPKWSGAAGEGFDDEFTQEEA